MCIRGFGTLIETFSEAMLSSKAHLVFKRCEKPIALMIRQNSLFRSNAPDSGEDSSSSVKVLPCNVPMIMY